MKKYASAILACWCIVLQDAHAKVDLVTLPTRDKVQLTIYNSADLTLVREERQLTLRKGLNRLQFSWANTLIDPTSVYLRPLAREADLEVLDTTFPGDRPQVLIWNVDSKVEAEVPVEVTYFTSGISWAADYVMVTDPGETQARVEGYVTVANNSGEDYEGAEVRLVLDAVPQFVIPAKVTYVSDVAQFTPKTVETAQERQKLTFRIKAHIDRGLLEKYVRDVKTGLPGVAYVQLDPQTAWPANLEVKLPNE